ncbi:dihydroneopterin aldolase [Gracilibacillus boraciitolerans JCM 21714]|uniref:7,8-dihydroneopterin aldolase n=1 Tax=Gracilibacillus boraciitolerans JCM 21714 TaxID=1298598 RepID=W4VLG3_9BACI|nr:dihydroneopterin aldolase [Gracilibacillus boraciitolerans]GAE94225.1 dihydroneopterin aldolase [Gracilibacillus boraciitolerans JCM 21714]
MDKIYLNEMVFYGFHGVFPEEKKLGQRFLVNLMLEVDLKKAGESDDIDQSIDYGYVYQLTREVLEGPSKNLLEAVAEELSTVLLSRFNLLKACTVKVIKPDPPIPGHYQSVAVEIYREQSL